MNDRTDSWPTAAQDALFDAGDCVVRLSDRDPVVRRGQSCDVDQVLVGPVSGEALEVSNSALNHQGGFSGEVKDFSSIEA